MRCCDCEYRHGCPEALPDNVGFARCERLEALMGADAPCRDEEGEPK